MWPIVADRVARSVGRSVTVVIPAKTAQPIEMMFALRTRVDPSNHVLDGSLRLITERANFEGRPIVKYRDIMQ